MRADVFDLALCDAPARTSHRPCADGNDKRGTHVLHDALRAARVTFGVLAGESGSFHRREVFSEQ